MPKKIPTIENCVSNFDALFIPPNRDERKKHIIKNLSRYKDATFRNLSTGYEIKVINKGIVETGQHASINKESTVVALNMKNLIINSVVFRDGIAPKPNQTKNFKFVEMIEFRCKIKGVGLAKLMVGKRTSGKYFEYCITKIENEKRHGKS